MYLKARRAYQKPKEKNKKGLYGQAMDEKEHIEFFWTHGNTLWEDRCAVACPPEDSPAAQRSLTTAAQHRDSNGARALQQC
jgi:hypothetical protein